MKPLAYAGSTPGSLESESWSAFSQSCRGTSCCPRYGFASFHRRLDCKHSVSLQRSSKNCKCLTDIADSMALEASARIAVTNAIDKKEDLGQMLGMRHSLLYTSALSYTNIYIPLLQRVSNLQPNAKSSYLQSFGLRQDWLQHKFDCTSHVCKSQTACTVVIKHAVHCCCEH